MSIMINLFKKNVLDKTRLSCLCPSCTKEILLDSDVFNETGIIISCYKCKGVFSVLKTTKVDNKIVVEVLRLENK